MNQKKALRPYAHAARRIELRVFEEAPVADVPLGNPDLLAAWVRRECFDPERVDVSVEHVIAIALDRKSRPIAWHVVHQGGTHTSLVSIPQVLRAAIVVGAAQIALAHNHPSGDPSPSAADLQITRQMREACRAIDLHFVDHLVIGAPGYYSFLNAGIL